MKYKCIKSYPGYYEGDVYSAEYLLPITVQNYTEYWQPIEEEKDYSKFIGFNGEFFIKGTKGYMYYDDGICYNNGTNNNSFIGIDIKTTSCLISELKVGDTVYIERGEMEQEDFMVYMGKDTEDWYIFQYIKLSSGIEIISEGGLKHDKQVIKFI